MLRNLFLQLPDEQPTAYFLGLEMLLSTTLLNFYGFNSVATPPIVVIAHIVFSIQLLNISSLSSGTTPDIATIAIAQPDGFASMCVAILGEALLPPHLLLPLPLSTSHDLTLTHSPSGSISQS